MKHLILATMLAAGLGASAAPLPIAQVKQWCATGYVGPRTTYGETPAEAANKKLVFDWTCMIFADGNVDGAFERYVSKDFCDHSHMVTAGLKSCAGWTETKAGFHRMYARFSGGPTVEFPVATTVDGDMVTQWGAGADIFRVQNGMITDHWDASPPVAIDMPAPNAKFSALMQKQIDEGKRLGGGL